MIEWTMHNVWGCGDSPFSDKPLPQSANKVIDI